MKLESLLLFIIAAVVLWVVFVKGKAVVHVGPGFTEFPVP